MLIYVPLLVVAMWSNVFDYALFVTFHCAASRISGRNGAIPTAASSHRRRFGGLVVDEGGVGGRICLWPLRCRHNKRPGLLLPPDSCELSKRRLRPVARGGVNEAMERSVSPASPAVSAATKARKKRLNSVELEDKS